MGLPDERVIPKACGRAANIWWSENHDKLQRLNNLTVLNLPAETTLAFAALGSRTM